MTPSRLAAVYMDTNVAVATLVPAIAHHRACAEFCDAVEADQTRVVCSRILHVEFAQVWFRLPTTPYLDAATIREFRLRAWDRNASVRERWMAEGVTRLDDFFLRFAQVVQLPLTEATWRASVGFMARHRLRSHDAIHAATAIRVGVPDFASVDADFRRVPNLRLELLRDNGA